VNWSWRGGGRRGKRLLGLAIRGVHHGKLTDDEWVGYGDSLRCGKALRHAVGPDNGELRWCQRNQPRRDTTIGENSGQRLSTTWYFLPLIRYPPAPNMNHRGDTNPSARLVGGEGIWTQDLFQLLYYEHLFRAPDRPNYSAKILDFCARTCQSIHSKLVALWSSYKSTMATILNRATDLTQNQALSSSNFIVTESSDPRLTDSPTLSHFTSISIQHQCLAT
jgi:hypothetical protein